MARQLQRRWASPSTIGVKVNLYRAQEVHALAAAIDRAELRESPVESLMVGDSYLMTHLGRPTTRLATAAEQAWGLGVLVELVREVRVATDAAFPAGERPWLIGDLPDGSADGTSVALGAADRMLTAGADVVKMEVGQPGSLDVLQALCEAGVPTVAHVGYTPQRGSLRRYGDSLDEALAIFALARQVRDAGACALVLEMVSEQVNRALCASPRDGLLTYSIFSGRAPYGGQSLNVWDAVFRPPSHARYFPPTAEYDAATQREAYVPEVITAKMAELLRLTVSGAFPLSPPARMPLQDSWALRHCDPWAGDPLRGRPLLDEDAEAVG
jgi:ketopantoate hydroxymethyltransferase